VTGFLENFWVRTGARLHFGQLDLNGSLGRIYGGIGLAIDEPYLEIIVEKSEELSLISSDKDNKRVEKIARKYLEFYELPGVKIKVIQALPSHSGLGSGTQLSLALGFAITQVYGLQPPLAELACVTDREGSRSGIGVAAFENGGFIVDGGKQKEIVDIGNDCKFQIPPLLARFPFPEEWAIILALPYNTEKMFGSKEDRTFKSLPLMDEQISGKICRHLLMKLLPSLIEKDLGSFGQAISEIQKQLGNYFATVQGGIFASELGYGLAEHMLAQGAVGIGQSSWGPTVYGFTTQDKKTQLLESTRKLLGDYGRVWSARGINHGADWGWNKEY